MKSKIHASKIIPLFLLLILIVACESTPPPSNNHNQEVSSIQEITKQDSSTATITEIQQPDPKKDPIKEEPKVVKKPITSTEDHSNNHSTIPHSNTGDYAWLDNYDPAASLEQQIPVPAGYERITTSKGSFGSWLRGLPLFPKGQKVMLYNGSQKSYQAGAHRVVNIDIGKRDLQQCADAVMRLKAEYHYSQKTYKDIHFNYTSGHTIRFADWSQGKKPKIKGSKVTFSSTNGKSDYSYKNFKKYLTNVYCYAGTASLSKELKKKPIRDILPGDVFIWGGFPGHAILVMDVAQHKETGKKIFLVAQSYMPAQNIHILKNFNNNELSPWYSEDFGDELETPEWTFSRDALKSF